MRATVRVPGDHESDERPPLANNAAGPLASPHPLPSLFPCSFLTSQKNSVHTSKKQNEYSCCPFVLQWAAFVRLSWAKSHKLPNSLGECGKESGLNAGYACVFVGFATGQPSK